MREERRALLDVLATLSPEQWSAPTACKGWTVHDVAAHLLGVHLGRLSRIRDGYEPLRCGPGETLPTFLDRINQEWVVAAVRLSPRVLTALLAGAHERVDEHFATLDLDALGGAVSWAGTEPSPVWLDMAREYTEGWVHQQQIREAAGVEPLDAARYRGPVLDTFARALPHTLRDAPAQRGAEVQVVVEGDGGGAWTAVRGDGGWSQRRGPAADPAATLRTDPDTFWRLCTRNVTLDDARRRVTLEGDPDLAEATLRIVSIILSE